MSFNWQALTPQEASELLFYKCVKFMLLNQTYNISADTAIKVLTQRLHGDYRQIYNTPEYNRAEKHVKHFKNTGLGRELF